MYTEAWRKFREGQLLDPLEAQIAAVVADHPEYQALLESGQTAVASEFQGEAAMSNPFLHMGLHLAIREQVSTDRPAGIAKAYDRLAERLGSALAAEHRMLDVLAQILWEAQSTGRVPDDQAYLDRIAGL